jgi:hypothetical protein
MTCRVPAVAAGVAAALLVPAVSRAGTVERLAVTRDAVVGVGVAGGRVYWAQWDGSRTAVFARSPFAPLRRVLRIGGLQTKQDVTVAMGTSARRIAVDVVASSAELDDVYEGIVGRAGAPADGSPLRAITDADLGYERLQDVDGHAVLTSAERRIGKRDRRTSRAYVRDFAAADPRPRPAGPRVVLADGEGGEDVESRIAGPWVATLRRSRRPVVTVYERRTTRLAWRVRLPAWRHVSSPYRRGLVWDLAADGSIAVALELRLSGPRARRQELGWAAPGGAFRRVTYAVTVRAPFLLRGSELTYVRPRDPRHLRLYRRWPGGPALALTPDLPPGLLATDGRRVAVIAETAAAKRCVLTAALPVDPAQRWRCP